MRIALVTSSYAPHLGGVEEHVKRVAGELSARGHQVVVWTVARDGRSGVRVVDGIEVWDLPTPLPSRSVRGLVSFLVRLPGALRAWGRARRRARPQLLHLHCFGPNGTYGHRLARWWRVPFVLTSHGETAMDDDGLFDQSALARWSLRAALRDAAAVTACSRVTLHDLERFGLPAGTGEVVFNGVQLDGVTPRPPAGLPPRYLAAVARIERNKGFDLLLTAFAESGLPADVHLVIGGSGSQEAALRSVAHELGVGDTVHFTGRLSSEEVAGVFSQAEVVVVPSRFEPFGIVVLEAWRAGAPLVCTDRGGPPEFVTDGLDGLLVDPHDTAALRAAIVRLVEDPAEAGTLGAAGRTRVHDFAWSTVVERYVALYRSSLGRG